MAYQFLDRQLELPRSPEEISSRFTHDQWLMTDSERSALTALLRKLQPECAIEVGTYKGGSLGVLAKYCKKAYTLDVAPSFRDGHGHEYQNVEFITGDSRETLPQLIKKIENSGEKLGFVLIDADHSEQGVRADLNNVLKYTPACPLYIIMHDSFNPGCRKGILTADWSANQHVHLVEADYVVGRFMTKEEDGFRTMWCGFALAALFPERRTGEPIIRQNESLMFNVAYWFSVHAYQKNWNPFYFVPRCLRTIKTTSRRFVTNILKDRSPELYASLKQGRWSNKHR
jgi:hypothetical protein